LLLCCLTVTAWGCGSGKDSSASTVKAARVEEVAGKWRLTRVGGKSPVELEVKIRSQEVEIAADGSWKSKIEFKLPGFGVPDVFNAEGKLSLPDSRIRMESGRMVVEPDFFMPVRPKGTPEGASEYERQPR
jgi:hypothetical protein